MILPRFICASFGLILSSALAQTPTAILEIQFSGHGAGFWGRYAVCYGKNRIAGWTSPQNGEAHRIEGIFSGPKTRIRGVLYAPGCALQTFDVAVKDARLYQYQFRCDPLPETEIRGVIEPIGRLNQGRNVRIEAKYVALWTPAFLGYDDGTTTVIPLMGESEVDEQGRFRLSIPDFAKDKIASASNHAAELRIWALDLADDRLFAKLMLLPRTYQAQPTRFGGIPIDSIGSSLLEFAFCYADPPPVRDKFGFTIRSEAENDCSR